MAGEGAASDATSGTDATSGQAASDTDKGTKGGTGTGAAGSSGTDDLGDAGKRALDAERDARAGEKKRADDAEAALKQLRDKDLPAAEINAREAAELKAEKAAWEAERRSLRTENAATAAATKLGFRDPDDALGYLARNPGKVQYDADGRPSNVEALLKDLVKDRPHLVGGTARAGGSADQGARGTAPNDDMNARIRAGAGRRS